MTNCPSCDRSTLCAECQATYAGVQAAIDDLERDGLVEVTAKGVALTAKGRQFMEGRMKQ